MRTFTIGFTRKGAEAFFGLIRAHEIERVIDVRLSNTSQLAGFARRDDLRFFLRELCDADYLHAPVLAPDDGLFRAYRGRKIGWPEFEARFIDLLGRREIEREFVPSDLDGACLLCSEPTAHHCHRRLVADYLNERWDAPIEVRHLS